MQEEIFLPDGVESRTEGRDIIMRKGDVELRRKLYHPAINIVLGNKKIVLKAEQSNKRVRALLGTFKAHIKNMLAGLEGFFVYKLKIVYSHFPISAKLEGKEVKIYNFLGEKYPRAVKVVDGTEVKIKGDEISVSSRDKEKAGIMASRLENICRKGFRDTRKFQDGIYIVGVEITGGEDG